MTHTINDNGLDEIDQFLHKYHTLCGNGIYLSTSILLAWAQDAEEEMEVGHTPTITIDAEHSVSGHEEHLTISKHGIRTVL